ncbi:unnamed protein product [Schistosoma mattheei]|uniref:Uncharacterized protein n=1 Tax=Schistosoma mattheei TaxID=31246 RepID=A0A3P8I0I6_9TREM|nr:unnamed protein product [Schistosoma mattheei]
MQNNELVNGGTEGSGNGNDVGDSNGNDDCRFMLGCSRWGGDLNAVLLFGKVDKNGEIGAFVVLDSLELCLFRLNINCDLHVSILNDFGSSSSSSSLSSSSSSSPSPSAWLFLSCDSIVFELKMIGLFNCVDKFIVGDLSGKHKFGVF